MSQETLLASAAFSLASSFLYAYVGYRVQARPTNPMLRLPANAFAAWWYGLAATTLLGAVHVGVAAFGRASLDSALLSTHIGIAMICVALWGLLYYLVYLYTGILRLWIPLAIGYVIYYAFLVYYVAASQPEGIMVDDWSVTVDYAQPIRGPFFGLVLVLLLVPQILGAIAYFALYFRTDDRTARYRILLVSMSIIIWFTVPLLAVPFGWGEHDWWQLVSRSIALLAAFTILAAYRPPSWVQSRYGIVAA